MIANRWCQKIWGSVINSMPNRANRIANCGLTKIIGAHHCWLLSANYELNWQTLQVFSAIVKVSATATITFITTKATALAITETTKVIILFWKGNFELLHRCLSHELNTNMTVLANIWRVYTVYLNFAPSLTHNFFACICYCWFYDVTFKVLLFSEFQVKFS